MATPLKILSTARRRVFEDVPRLSREEGIGFTALDSSSRKVTSAMRADVNKVGFLVQRAYFQAKGRFFSPDRYKPIHQRMAERSLGLKKPVDLSYYNAKTASHHRTLILDMYGWKRYGEEDRAALKEQALLLADKQKDSEVILFSLLDFCWKNKTEVPGYNEFAGIISQAYTDFETSLLKKIASNITDEQNLALLSLIENPEIAANFSEIKRVNQSTRQRKLNYNAELLEYFKGLFFSVKPLLDELKLSTEAIKHFSGQVLKSTLSQIRNIRDPHKKCLFIMAFAQDQYFLRQDYGVDAFIKQIRAIINQGKKHNQALKEKDEKELHEANASVLASSKNACHVLRLIVDISKDPLISLAEKNEKVLRLAESYFEAENPDIVDHIARLESNLANYDLNINLNRYLFGCSDSLQRSYAPILRLLEFDENHSVPSLIEAIAAFKDNNFEITESTPIGFLSEKDKKLMFLESSIPVISRYKVKLFVAIEQAIRRRRLTLKYSYRYGASQTYMISEEQWRLKSDEFIRAAGLEKYRDGKAVVYSLGRLLSQAYDTVNARYLRGENNSLFIDRKGAWSLKKLEPDFDASKYIPQLLSESKAILLYEVLCEIDSYTGFSGCFKHHSLKHSAKSTQNKLIYGTLMSLGTNLGHIELARAARGLSEKQLRDTEKLWFNEPSLERANQTIVRLIQSLPLPTVYNTARNDLHTSSDGKKVVVAVNSLLANYSYKYYGKEQGVTVNSFLDEKQSFFHVNVMTSSDREAPYMMDGLVKSVPAVFHEPYLDETGFREDRRVKEHKHSTDTHGYTEAIFAGLHFLDVAYAPRIADVADQTIYAFEARSLRKNTTNPIAPNSSINKKLILDNWDGILRVMSTIKLNYCSASLMLRMLSAGGADSPLYAALKEFGRLIKSKFILNFIDDEELRRAITKQLNRVELGQKMASAVFYGRSGQFHVGTADEIQRVMLCKTILQNAIILWNYLFLSDYYNGLTTENEKRVVSEMISKGSVIAWKHINMKGIFDFDHDVPNSFRSTIKQMLGLEMIHWEEEVEFV